MPPAKYRKTIRYDDGTEITVSNATTHTLMSITLVADDFHATALSPTEALQLAAALILATANLTNTQPEATKC